MIEFWQLVFALGLFAPVLALGMGLGCGCMCGDCEIFTDAFPDTDEAGWTQTSGTWVEDLGYMATASSTARLTCNTTHPDAVPSHYVSVSMYGANADEIRVHVGTNHFAQVTIGDPNGCLALYDGATLLTKIRVSAPATTAKTLKVWYGLTPVADGADSQFAAQWDNGTILRYNVTRAGNGVGLGTGSIGSTVRFDDFVYEKHYTTTDIGCKTPTPPTCTIVSDAFDRADDTNIGCLWTETAGTWAISGNKLRVTTTSAKATCNCLHPQDAGAVSIAVTFRSSATDKIRVFVDTVANDYVEFDISGDTVKIFLAAVEQVSVSYTMAINTDYAVVVTQAQNAISVSSGGTCITACNKVTPAAATDVGLGTGGTVGGNVDFNDFTLSRAYDANNLNCVMVCSSCSWFCDDAAVITAVVLRMNGITDGTCGNCDTLWNDVEFELPFLTIAPAGNCEYHLIVPAYLCGSDLEFDVGLGTSAHGGSDFIDLLVSEAGIAEIQFQSADDAAFFAGDAVPVDCDTFFPKTLPPPNAFGTATLCTDTALTTATIVRVIR